MAITRADKEQAEKRMQALMRLTPRAISARYDRRHSKIVVGLDSGLELAFPSDLAEGLRNAKPADLSAIEISPTGLGLHFPKLDADLYIPGLLEGAFGSPSWMARVIGQKGGASKSEAKRLASRRNGKLGGRPRKVATA
jgi:hypothetical protein